MKVLFVGGTGIISTAVSQMAVEKGINLFLLNRGKNSQHAPKDAKVIKGDIRDRKDASKLLKMHTFDAVVNWVAYIPQHVQADIEFFRGKVGQYIFISSASAYQKPPSDWLITESTPLANPYWQYSRDKIACEERLMAECRESGFPVTIVRPSYTYCERTIPAAVTSFNNPWTLVDRMRKGKKIIIHGDGSSLWVMTHSADFAKGFLGLLGNSRATGHAVHITSDEALTWNQIYGAIADAAGVKLKPVYIPSDMICKFIPDLTGSLLGDKTWSFVFDNSKIRRLVPGFTCTVPFAQGIRRSVEWFEADKSRCTIDAGLNKSMDRLIAAYEKWFDKLTIKPLPK